MFDVIGLTETWLSNSIFDNEILPSNYTLFRCDRQSRGGGVLIAVNDNIPCQKLSSPENLEATCVRLNLPNPITVCVIYAPPNSTSIYYETLFTFISNLSKTSGKLIILGDFNFPDINWDSLSGHSPISNQFCDLVFDTGLYQLIDTPTHSHGNILDLVLTNLDDDNISNIQVHSIPLLPSDHFDITFSLSTTVSVSSKQTTTHFTFNYPKGDYQGLTNYLCCADFTSCYLSDDVEYIWQIIECQLTTAMHQFIPVNKIHCDQHPIWFNSDIRHCIKRLRTLRRRYKRRPTQHILNVITSLENSLQDKIKTAKQNYESNLITNNASINNSKIFRYLKSITKSTNNLPVINFNSSTADTDCSKANLLNQYFHSVFHNPSPVNIDILPTTNDQIDSIDISVTEVYEALISLDVNKSCGIDKIAPRVLYNCAGVLCEPLHHLFSMCLCHATLPSSWKIHKVVPVFKAGDPTSATNYRPISLLSNTSKVLERLIYNKIIDHVSKFITPFQFGFTKNCSTLQQMLIFLDYIINSSSQTDVVYFDISKAFDTVSHDILLNKLWSIGITGVLWAWFKDYLTYRFQSVCINNSYSDLLPVLSGVPQGSILGPLLFIIYINNMTSYINQIQLLKFADDTKCFKHICTLTDSEVLQENVIALLTWSKDTDLNFNLKKFVHLSFKRKLETTYTISDITIPRNDSHKDLGLVLSDNLSWDKHYKSISARAYKILGLIRRTIDSTHSTSVKASLYISLVRSQLLYCTQVWRPHLMKDILIIERIQRRATKYLLNDYTSSYKTRLIKLKILPLMYLFELQDLLFAIKSIKSPTTQFNIHSYINFSSANTRSGASNKLIIPRHLNNISRHSYFHRLPTLWNFMPIFDLDLPFQLLKSKFKDFLWNHFVTNFDDNDNCTLHYLCPCSKCHLTHPPTTNWNML